MSRCFICNVHSNKYMGRDEKGRELCVKCNNRAYIAEVGDNWTFISVIETLESSYINPDDGVLLEFDSDAEPDIVESRREWWKQPKFYGDKD